MASERSVAMEEMTNVLEYFEDDLQLQKNETKERINQLEILQQPLKTLSTKLLLNLETKLNN